MDNDYAIAMMMIITMIMMIILISQWNCSDIRDLINQGRNCILSKGGGFGGQILGAYQIVSRHP